MHHSLYLSDCVNTYENLKVTYQSHEQCGIKEAKMLYAAKSQEWVWLEVEARFTLATILATEKSWSMLERDGIRLVNWWRAANENTGETWLRDTNSHVKWRKDLHISRQRPFPVFYDRWPEPSRAQAKVVQQGRREKKEVAHRSNPDQEDFIMIFILIPA